MSGVKIIERSREVTRVRSIERSKERCQGLGV